MIYSWTIVIFHGYVRLPESNWVPGISHVCWILKPSLISQLQPLQHPWPVIIGCSSTCQQSTIAMKAPQVRCSHWKICNHDDRKKYDNMYICTCPIKVGKASCNMRKKTHNVYNLIKMWKTHVARWREKKNRLPRGLFPLGHAARLWSSSGLSVPPLSHNRILSQL